MKIAFLTRSLDPEFGGLDRYSFEVVSRVAGTPGYKVTALVEKKTSLDYDVQVLDRRVSIFALVKNIFSSAKYLRSQDIVHALDLFPYGLIAALATIGSGQRLFICGVGTESVVKLSHPLLGPVLKWVYHRAEKVICISKYTKKRILEKAPDLKNLEVVYLGIDYQKFSTLPEVSRKPHQIIGVGALKRRKGYHVSIEAVAKLVPKYHDLKYFIIGSQAIVKFYKQLKDQVRKLGIEKNVVFLQDVPDRDLIKLYAESSVFVLTSVNIGQHFEGYGLVFLEAAAAGLPSVGTKNCGIEEAVMDNQTGLLVAQNDASATTHAIGKLLSDRNLAKEFSLNARGYASQMTWDHTVSGYMKYYKHVE